MTLMYPRITWSGGAHTIEFDTPIDNPLSRTFDEISVVRVPSTGEQDSWTFGQFPRLEYDQRWIRVNGTPQSTGWNSLSPTQPGVRAFLAHQRQNKDTFEFEANRDVPSNFHNCRLIEAREEKERPGGHYRVRYTIEDVDGKDFDEY